MGTSQNVDAWAKQANTVSPQTDTDAPWPEGTMTRTNINNYSRSNMSAVKKKTDDLGGNLTAGGTANALTVTTNSVISTAHLADGYRLGVWAASTNTSATVTIAVDAEAAKTIKRADGSNLAIGVIQAGMFLDLVYEAGAGVFCAMNISPVIGSRSEVLVASGTVAAATLDLVLTNYAAFRGVRFVLSGFLPATDGVNLYMRFSTDGGSSYDAGVVDYGFDVTSSSNQLSQNNSFIALVSPSANLISNGAAGGYNGEITLLNQASTALWSRVTHQGSYLNSAGTPTLASSMGSGARRAAQDTNAVRFLFSSGNIAAGNYAVYAMH